MDHLIRQFDIIPPSVLGQEITLIGCGAIGSFTALALVKMGFTELTAYDFDEVSIENMNCQWFRMKDIGKKKATALAELIEDFTGEKIVAMPEEYNGQELKGLVISAVDSMAVRRMIWEHTKKSYGVKYLIDPRMASEFALNYVMDPHDEADRISYEKVLYTDAQAVQERCTAKATMYTATMIAGYVAKAVKDIVTKNPYARVTHWDIKANHMISWKKKEAAPEVTV